MVALLLDLRKGLLRRAVQLELEDVDAARRLHDRVDSAAVSPWLSASCAANVYLCFIIALLLIHIESKCRGGEMPSRERLQDAHAARSML